jgi:hypothetical protein
MIGIPWFLMAFGIILVLLGVLLDRLSPFSRKRPRQITAKMRNKDIARLLKEQERIPVASLVVLAGITCFTLGLIGKAVVQFFFL